MTINSSNQLIPAPQHTALAPKPYEGTCAELIKKTRDTVHQTLNSLNYSAMNPWIQTLSQLQEGKTFSEVELSSKNERPATNCAGNSNAILDNLKQKHGIDGMFAVMKSTSNPNWYHAGVIVQCNDGYIRIEPGALPEETFTAIAFNCILYNGNGASISAAQPGSPFPLTARDEEERCKCDRK